MAQNVRVLGELKLQNNIDRQLRKLGDKAHAGLKWGLNEVAAEADILTPRKDGFLRGSQYVQTDRGIGKGPRGVIGNTISYAPIVHEMPESNTFSSPGTGPGFLLKAAITKGHVVLDAIWRFAKI